MIDSLGIIPDVSIAILSVPEARREMVNIPYNSYIIFLNFIVKIKATL